MSGGNERIAAERLYTVVNDSLRDQFSKRTIEDVISGEREKIMHASTIFANEQVEKFGISVVDVRVKRIVVRVVQKQRKRFVLMRIVNVQ